MEHQKIKELIYLSFYDEINKDQKEELEKHLALCPDCKKEYEKQKEFNLFLSEKEDPVNEQVLNDARRELRLALLKERKSFFNDLLNSLTEFFTTPYKIAFSGLTVLIAGFLIGYLVFNQPEETVKTPQIQNDDNFSFAQNNFRITNIQFLNKNPETGEIEFTFDAVKPMQVKGNINDQRIQNVLTYSMLYEDNPGARLNSINAISQNQNVLPDNEIKEALINVTKYDENAGVRREAIKLLNKFPYDEQLKDTYLFVLLNDANSGMRIEAINSLFKAQKEGYQFDENEISVFKEKMKTDDNDYIRYRARTVVQEKN